MSRPKYRKRAGKYQYALTEDWTVFVPYTWAQHAAEYRQAGLTWMTCHWCYITLKKGYAIDGATMAPDVELWMEWFFSARCVMPILPPPESDIYAQRRGHRHETRHGQNQRNDQRLDQAQSLRSTRENILHRRSHWCENAAEN